MRVSIVSATKAALHDSRRVIVTHSLSLFRFHHVVACMMELHDQKEQLGDYMILERSDSLLHKWRSCRWDFFQLNTPVKFSQLHGQTIPQEHNEWLLDRPLSQDLAGWDQHICDLGILKKVQFQANVQSVQPLEDGTFLATVKTPTESSPTYYRSQNVVACTGMNDHNIVPKELSEKLPSFMKQHVTGGFQFQHLQPGNVLVVGSSQSGVQLSQLLVDHEPQRQIYLACSTVGGCPRSFRGKDIFEWFHYMKFLYIPQAALPTMPPEKAEALRYGGMGAPVTGPNRPMSPFSLAKQGVKLVGKLQDVVVTTAADHDDNSHPKTTKLCFGTNLPESLQASKAGHDKVLNMLRNFCDKEWDDREQLPPEEPEAEWQVAADDPLFTDTGPLQLDCEESGIANVIWASGWAPDMAWLQPLMATDDETSSTNTDFDARTHLPGRIVSENHPGLYFAGFPWIGTIQSMNLVNMDADAQVIVQDMLERQERQAQKSTIQQQQA